MTFNARNIQLPRHGRGSALLLRFIILILDLTALICLSVDLSNYHKWVARSKDALTHLVIADFTNRASYYRDRDIITHYRYWQDPIVLVIILSSLIYTAYVYLRPAWTQRPFNQIANMVSELLLFFIILGGSVPAFVLSPIQRPDSLGLRVEVAGYYIYRPEETVFYSTGHKLPKKELQVVAFALVWSAAFFHFCLSCVAVFEHRNRAVDSGLVKEEVES